MSASIKLRIMLSQYTPDSMDTIMDISTVHAVCILYGVTVFVC